MYTGRPKGYLLLSCFVSTEQVRVLFTIAWFGDICRFEHILELVLGRVAQGL